MKEEVVFLAIIPGIASAIKLHGDAGMRITFDVDESQVPEALKLALYRGELLKLRIQRAE